MNADPTEAADSEQDATDLDSDKNGPSNIEVDTYGWEMELDTSNNPDDIESNSSMPHGGVEIGALGAAVWEPHGYDWNSSPFSSPVNNDGRYPLCTKFESFTHEMLTNYDY